jgi:tetratricopeptide (TPR) repeat protein
MVGVVCVLTFLAQRAGGAVSSLSAVPALMRLSNVVNSYIMYVWRMVWPWPLSFFYPYEPIPLWQFISCSCGLVFLSFLTWRAKQTKSYLLFGWLWYLGTLVPVIGIIQVGAQSMADRYTYIPSIGFFVAATWFFDFIRKKIHLSKLLPSTLAVACIFTYMYLSLDYLLNWINEKELYSYGLSINKDNVMALNNYGIILTQLQDTEEAIKLFEHNIEVNPKSTGSRTNLASIYLSKEDYSKALDTLLAALQTDQRDGTIYLLLGQVFNQVHDYEIAEKLFKKSLEQQTLQPKTVASLADLLINQGRYAEAVELGTQYLVKLHDKEPQKAMLLWCLGRAHFASSKTSTAKEELEEALRLQPIFPYARRELAKIALSTGDIEGALKQLKMSLSSYKFDSASRIYIGKIYASKGQYGRAYQELKRALSNKIGLSHEDLVDAHTLMGILLTHFGEFESANIHKARIIDIQKLSQPVAVEPYRQRLFNTVITHQSDLP